MRINVDPNTDAGGFGYAEPGETQLRITAVDYKKGQKAPYLAWKAEFVDPNTPTVEKNTDGTSKKLGNIFENTTLKVGAQFRLRQLTDALGIEWADLDTDTMIGAEFDAQVGIDEYQGTLSNCVKKFIAVK